MIVGGERLFKPPGVRSETPGLLTGGGTRIRTLESGHATALLAVATGRRSEVTDSPDTPDRDATAEEAGQDPSRDRVQERISRSNLDGADLAGVNLARAELSSVTLCRADLGGACLAGARLTHVDLSGANLTGADLRGASLSDVDLAGATLDDADLCGANLKAGKAAGVTAVGARFSGATLDAVEFADADLSGARLDGCEVQEGAFQGVTFRGADLRGLLGSQCTIEGCRFEASDLSGATFETLLLRDSQLVDCAVEGTLFRRSKLQDVAVEGGTFDGCVLEQCLGTDPALEERLRQAGAELSLPATVRAWRTVRGNRRIQVTAAVLVALAALSALILVLTPRWWPSSVLAGRMDRLQASAPEGWCERQVELGAILAQRQLPDTGRQLWLLGSAADCHLQAGRADEAEALFRTRMELPGASVEQKLEAHVELGRFYTNTNRWEEAAAAARAVAEDARAPSTLRLRAQRLQSEVLAGQGTVGPEVPEWVALHRAIADTILAIEPPNAEYLLDAPTRLYVLALHDEAEQLLDGIEPPVEREDAWAAADAALDELVALGRTDEASSLLDHLEGAERYADEVSSALVGHGRFQLLVDGERIEEARAVVEELALADTPTATAVARVLTARLAVLDGDGATVLAALEGLEAAESLPAELAGAVVWIRADGHLLLGQEEEAIAAVEPLFAAVTDHDDAARLLVAIEGVARRMERPELATEMLGRVDNPLLADMGGGRNVVLTALRQRARDGALAADDPELQRLVRGDDVWAAIQGFDLLMESARLSGDEGAVTDAVRGWAAGAEDEKRAAFGLWLVDVELGRGNRAGAVALVEELDLWAVATHQRGRLYEVMAADAVSREALDEARQLLDRLRLEDPPLDPWHEYAVTLTLLGALLERQDYDAVVTLARAGAAGARAASPRIPEHEIAYTREAAFALVALGRAGEAEADIAALAREHGPCLARHQEYEVFERAAADRFDADALSSACSGDPGSIEHVLAACQYLAQRGHPARALAILEPRDRKGLAAHQWIALVLAREHFRATGGDPDAAARELETLYTDQIEIETRVQVAQALIDVHAKRRDGDAVVASYTRVAASHPDADLGHLWEHAAYALGRQGLGDRIADMGGDPSWQLRVQAAVVEGQVRALLDQGEFDGAWAALVAGAGSAMDDGQRQQIIWLAQETADRGGPVEAHVQVLAEVREGAVTTSEAWQRATLHRAIALERLGQGEAALAEITPLVAQTLGDGVRDDALRTYGHIVGRQSDPAAVTGLLAALDPDLHPAAVLHDARFSAAEALLDRGEPGAARDLLEPLAGTPLAEELVRQRYHVLARAHVEAGGAADAVDLPSRFPAAAGVSACTLDIIVMQALPWGGPEADVVRGRLATECDPTARNLGDVLYLAEVEADAEPARGISVLERHRTAASPIGSAADRLTLAQARYLARGGETVRAVELYMGLLDGAEEAWIVTDAATAIVAEIYAPDRAVPTERAEALVERALGRIGDDPYNARRAHEAMVRFHRQRGETDDAIRWQRKVLERIPEGEDDWGYAVLALVRLDLEANGLPSPTWRVHLDPALAALPPATGSWRELARIRLATHLALHTAPGDTLEDAIREAAEPVPAGERQNFVAATADDLEWLLQNPDLAQAVRQLNDGRF